MTITQGQSLIVDNLLHYINYPSGLNALFYKLRNENNNCWVPESTKNNQHKITTNIGKRNLSGAQ